MLIIGYSLHWDNRLKYMYISILNKHNFENLLLEKKLKIKNCAIKGTQDHNYGAPSSWDICTYQKVKILTNKLKYKILTKYLKLLSH
jgi:hypothetical protein